MAGVIPGHPLTDKLKHYLQLVVNDFLEFWDPGVYFSGTYEYPSGMLYLAMLISVICDMLTACQVIGYTNTPTAHYFCMLCELDIDDIHVLDRRQWPQKDLPHIHWFAALWRDACSEGDQKAIFEACGWCWLPLFDLPYWNLQLYTRALHECGWSAGCDRSPAKKYLRIKHPRLRVTRFPRIRLNPSMDSEISNTCGSDLCIPYIISIKLSYGR